MICSGMAFVPPDSIFQLHEDNNHLSSTSPNVLSPSCAPQDFQGVSRLMMRRSMSFSGVERCEEGRLDDDMSDDGCALALGEKKRRLNMEQVRALEKSFELGNKLEPERKMQLAKALGLQPRQIAIWFQNRRARWKTKQLEKDYDVLKKQFEALKADNDALKTQNQKLHSELMALKKSEPTGVGAINLNNKENDCCWSNGSENSIDVNHGTTGTASADHSPPYDPQPSNKDLNHGTTATAMSLTQLLQTSSSRVLDLQCPKIDQTAQDDQGFCNMFTGIEEQGPNFWPWPEQQHFH